MDELTETINEFMRAVAADAIRTAIVILVLTFVSRIVVPRGLRRLLSPVVFAVLFLGFVWWRIQAAT